MKKVMKKVKICSNRNIWIEGIGQTNTAELISVMREEDVEFLPETSEKLGLRVFKYLIDTDQGLTVEMLRRAILDG
jgi:hypothetical protein